MPSFDPSASTSFAHFSTGQLYYLTRADRLQFTPERFAEVTAICNEPEVYRWLFRDALAGQPYPATKAADLFAWAAAGWREGTHFVFIVTDSEGMIAACCDIKSADLHGAEIGYWSSRHHRGIMTNAVVRLCELAARSGFKALTARTRKGNAASARVLGRAGFSPVAGRDDPVYDHFRRVLGG